MPSPTVSVIIAVKNAARYLAECLDSVAAQTVECHEILIVDGGSTDTTEAVARSYGKVIFFQQNGSGIANAWNCGLQRARGEFVTFIDSDDVWTPHKLARQVELLQGNARLEGVIGKVRFMLQPGETPPHGFRDRVLHNDHIGYIPGVLMARRRLFKLLGDWPEDQATTSDTDWFAKLKDSGLPIGVVDDVLLKKRVHSENYSYLMATDAAYPREMLRLLYSSILRKRAAAMERKTARGGS